MKLAVYNRCTTDVQQMYDNLECEYDVSFFLRMFLHAADIHPHEKNVKRGR